MIAPLQPGMTAPVYLRCKAALGSAVCAGTLTLSIGAQSTRQAFRIPTRRSAELTVTLPERARAGARADTTHALHATQPASPTDPPRS